MTISFPSRLPIVPLGRPPRAIVSVPGSKSITNRALVLAALTAKGDSQTIRGALRSEDTEVMIECLRALGFRVFTEWDEPAISVRSGSDEPLIPAAEANLFVGNSGTTMRFLTAMVSLGQGHYRLDGVSRMRERPIEDLLIALRILGVNARSENSNGCPPVIIESKGLQGGQVRIRGDVSSQFLSGLLLAAPFARRPMRIEIDGPLVSRPYVDMTLKMLQGHGFQFRDDLPRETEFIGSERGSVAEDYLVEPDASAASYFFAAAAITGGQITVRDIPEDSIQGDVRFVDALAKMGCRVERCSSGVTVHGRPLRGIDIDMNEISDTVMTLAAVACFAHGPTTIRNVAHIRHKETDRLNALATELRRIGATVNETSDGLIVAPGPLHGAEIETYDDHRMAMSLALVGLRVPGIVIKDPACVNKTYPEFFQDLEALRHG